MDWSHFAPMSGAIGGLLIGFAASMLLLGAGRIAGISGLVEQLLRGRGAARGLAVAFLVALPVGSWIVARGADWLGVQPTVEPRLGPVAACLAAGLLVGMGARLSGGCTSGHGVCGLPRPSRRSWLATLVFMTVAVTTALASSHLGMRP
jgi:hypothetical protein